MPWRRLEPQNFAFFSFTSASFIIDKKAIETCFIVTVGGFEGRQTLSGEIAEFNMWSKEMSLDELLSMPCGTKGDVSSWETLKTQGSSTKAYRVFPDCKGNCIKKFFFPLFFYFYIHNEEKLKL